MNCFVSSPIRRISAWFSVRSRRAALRTISVSTGASSIPFAVSELDQLSAVGVVRLRCSPVGLVDCQKPSATTLFERLAEKRKGWLGGVQEKELDRTRRRQDEAYKDKLDGRITEEFWNRQMSELTANEQRTASALAALTEPLDDKALTVARTLEPAQQDHSLYLAHDPVEQAKLLSLVLSNSELDEVRVYPKYKVPFDLIAQRAKTEDWLGRLDSNQHHPH